MDWFSSKEAQQVFDTACNWNNGKCTRLRVAPQRKVCCIEHVDCKELGVSGCNLGDNKPLLCKASLCQYSENKLKDENPNLFEFYNEKVKDANFTEKHLDELDNLRLS